MTSLGDRDSVQHSQESLATHFHQAHNWGRLPWTAPQVSHFLCRHFSVPSSELPSHALVFVSRQSDEPPTTPGTQTRTVPEMETGRRFSHFMQIIGLLTTPVPPPLTEINILRPRQNCRHFADYIFKWILLNENELIWLEISLKFVPNVSINDFPALVQIMAGRPPGDKPLSKPIVISLLTHISLPCLWNGSINISIHLCEL